MSRQNGEILPNRVTLIRTHDETKDPVSSANAFLIGSRTDWTRFKAIKREVVSVKSFVWFGLPKERTSISLRRRGPIRKV